MVMAGQELDKVLKSVMSATWSPSKGPSRSGKLSGKESNCALLRYASSTGLCAPTSTTQK